MRNSQESTVQDCWRQNIEPLRIWWDLMRKKKQMESSNQVIPYTSGEHALLANEYRVCLSISSSLCCNALKSLLFLQNEKQPKPIDSIFCKIKCNQLFDNIICTKLGYSGIKWRCSQHFKVWSQAFKTLSLISKHMAAYPTQFGTAKMQCQKEAWMFSTSWLNAPFCVGIPYNNWATGLALNMWKANLLVFKVLFTVVIVWTLFQVNMPRINC